MPQCSSRSVAVLVVLADEPRPSLCDPSLQGVGVPRFQLPSDLGQLAGHTRQRASHRLRVGDQDVRPQLRIAPGDAGEVSEAGPRHVPRSRGCFPERPREREGENMGNVAHPCHLAVVARRIAADHPGPDGPPQGLHPLDRRRRVPGRRGHDAHRAGEEIGPGVVRPLLVAAGHGMGAHVAHAGGKQPRERVGQQRLHAADVGDQGARRQARGGLGEQPSHGADGRRQDHQVRAGRRLRRIERHPIHQPALAGPPQRLGAAPAAHHLAGQPALAGGPRQGAAEQAEAQHGEPFEPEGRVRHEPSSAIRRSAFTSRSFSSGSPIVIRTCSGIPKPPSGRTITPSRSSRS
jgi:hypothetical protein